MAAERLRIRVANHGRPLPILVIARSIGSLALLLALTGWLFPRADAAAGAQGEPARASGDLQMLHVQGSVYMLAGAGANITVQVEDAGVVLVDTGSAASSAGVEEAIKRLTKKQVRYIINTQHRDDHTGGNGALEKAFKNPPLIAHENVLKRMTSAASAGASRPVSEQPTDTFFTPIRDLYNGEAIQSSISRVKPTATRSSTSADPTSSAPATSS